MGIASIVLFMAYTIKSNIILIVNVKLMVTMCHFLNVNAFVILGKWCDMVRIESDNPYEAVAKIIHEYREQHHEYLRSDFAVTLKIGDRVSTELFAWEENEYGMEEYFWKWDWYEGEKEVYLCGFMPIENISFFNVDEMMGV